MSKNEQNSKLGLSFEELEEILNSSKSTSKLQKYNDELQNCDLSNSAIQLITKKDLGAIQNITKDINAQFSPKHTVSNFKIWIGIGASALLITVLTFLQFNSSKDDQINRSKVEKVIEEPIQAPFTHEITATPQQKKAASSDVEGIKNQEQQAINQTTEIIVGEQEKDTLAHPEPAEKIIDKTTETKTNKEQEGNKAIKEEHAEQKTTDESSKIKAPITAKRREVRAIRAMKSIDPKYKNQSYSLTDLVGYFGGDKQLEKELLKKLKGRIGDEDIPKNNFSVVFNFTVTARGKVKEVTVQSIVAPKVESLIQEAVFNLSDWNKGDKRIPIDYTVYVTFK